MTNIYHLGDLGSLSILPHLKFVFKIYSFKCVPKMHIQDPACEDQRAGRYQARWSKAAVGCSQRDPSVRASLLLRNGSKPGTKGVVKCESVINRLINKQAFVEDLVFSRTALGTRRSTRTPCPAPPTARLPGGERKSRTATQGGFFIWSRSYQWFPVLAAHENPRRAFKKYRCLLECS